MNFTHSLDFTLTLFIGFLAFLPVGIRAASLVSLGDSSTG